MDAKLLRLMVIPVFLVALCLLALPLWATPSQAGGPDPTPCANCSGGMNPTPVPNLSRIDGYVYNYTTGAPAPTKGMGVTLTGCSWDAVWGTDDYGFFYFNNLGEGMTYVNLQLPPNGHPINPNVVVNTTGMTDTVYTVYLGYYLGDTPPSGPFTTPDGKSLSGSSPTVIVREPGSTADGAPLPDVGGTLPDSYLVIGLSALLLMALPVAGLSRLRAQPAQP
jgi:hypothetical protein